MSAFINLDAAAEQLTIELLDGAMIPARRERALATALTGLAVADHAYVMAQTLGTVLAVLEAIKKANPAARLQVDLTVTAMRRADKESNHVH